MDLRDFVSRLKERGELREVEDALSPDLEVSALSMRVQEAKGPALLFKNVKGYEKAKVVSGIFAGPGMLMGGRRKLWTRVAMALGIEATKYVDFIERLLERLRSPIKPHEVKTGACKEEVHVGRGINVFEFPTLKHFPADGERYGHGCLVAKDPDTGLQVWSLTRWMVVNKDTLAIPLLDLPESAVAKVYRKYEAKGQDMPCALVVGGDPSITVASSFTALPPGAYIPEVASSLCRTPLELVKAETLDLLIPANAELVIEGKVLARGRVDEGPYTNFYRRLPRRKQPAMKIGAITHRKDPLIPVFVEPAKYGDLMTLASLTHSAELKRLCDEYYFGTVRWVHLPPEVRLGICIVAGLIVHPGWPWVVARHLFNNSMYFDKVLWVAPTLEPDFELEACFNDWNYKAHPEEGWIISAEEYKTPISARYPAGPTTSTLEVVADFDPGKFKPEWLGIRCCFEDIFPKEVRDAVVRNWRKYGMEVEPITKEIPPYWAARLSFAE